MIDSLVIDYLAIEKTWAVDSLIKSKFSRLQQVYNRIQKCQVKLANIAQNRRKKLKHSYLISINLELPEGVQLYTLRFPQALVEDSLHEAIASAFAKIYRQLIELQSEEQNNLTYQA